MEHKEGVIDKHKTCSSQMPFSDENGYYDCFLCTKDYKRCDGNCEKHLSKVGDQIAEHITPIEVNFKTNFDKKGIKYDKNKPRLAEMFIDFNIAMEELCKVWEFGANKYTKSNWKLVDNAIDRYTNAMLRHLIAEEKETYDSESTFLHASHIAFNALARLHFISIKQKREKQEENKEN